jgi:anti-anti-sigma regulatory factor
VASKNSVQRIQLDKNSGIDGVTDFARRVSEALANSNRLEFDLSEVSELELPVIQVLYAAARSAVAAGGEAGFTGPVPESVATRLLVTGLSRSLVRDGQALQSGMPGFGVPGGRP